MCARVRSIFFFGIKQNIHYLTGGQAEFVLVCDISTTCNQQIHQSRFYIAESKRKVQRRVTVFVFDIHFRA